MARSQDDLDEVRAAATAYRKARAAVTAAEAALLDARADVPEARERLYAALERAARAGSAPTSLMRATGYNRETVRRILRARGIEAG